MLEHMGISVASVDFRSYWLDASLSQCIDWSQDTPWCRDKPSEHPVVGPLSRVFDKARKKAKMKKEKEPCRIHIQVEPQKSLCSFIASIVGFRVQRSALCQLELGPGATQQQYYSVALTLAIWSAMGVCVYRTTCLAVGLYAV